MTARPLQVFLLLTLAACSSVREPFVQPISLNVQPVELDVAIDPSISLAESEWWNIGGYERQVDMPSRHGWFHDGHCRPQYRVIAMLALPEPHPFIAEIKVEHDQSERERAELGATSPILMTFTPISLKELEEEFLRSALPRLKDDESQTLYCGWLY